MYNPQAIAESLEPIVKKAGSIAQSFFRSGLERQRKGDGSIVTQADLEVEKFLIRELAQLIPGSGFFAEESGQTDGNEYVWVIDPIDGTTNFSTGNSFFCVSVALAFNEEVIVGMVYSPISGDLFSASKGNGSYLNGSPIMASKREDFAKSVVSTGWIGRGSPIACYVCILSEYCSSIRKYGSAALEISYCAMGTFDAFVASGLNWWDFAAGLFILHESGGASIELDGSAVGPKTDLMILGNEKLCQKISQQLKKTSRT